MRPRINEKGEGRIGCIFWSVMGILFVVVAIKAVPVKIASMKLEDHMQELAMTQGKRGADFHQNSIYKMAQHLELDIQRKQIKVKKYPERLVIDVNFVAPLDILGFKYDWNIHLHLDRDIYWI